jgi:protein SCO1
MMNRRRMLAGLVALPLATAASGGEALARRKKPKKKAATTRTWSTEEPRERIRRKYFPDVELQTHRGESVRFYQDLVKDKSVVFSFMYATCEGICVPTTANLRRVHKLLAARMGKDLHFYSFTLRPEVDTVAVLQRYAAEQKVGAGWSLLTGTPDDLERLRRSLGFTDPDPVRDADRTNHAGVLKYGNEPKMYWGGCPALIKPELIAENISRIA